MKEGQNSATKWVKRCILRVSKIGCWMSCLGHTVRYMEGAYFVLKQLFIQLLRAESEDI